MNVTCTAVRLELSALTHSHASLCLWYCQIKFDGFGKQTTVSVYTHLQQSFRKSSHVPFKRSLDGAFWITWILLWLILCWETCWFSITVKWKTSHRTITLKSERVSTGVRSSFLTPSSPILPAHLPFAHTESASLWLVGRTLRCYSFVVTHSHLSVGLPLWTLMLQLLTGTTLSASSSVERFLSTAFEINQNFGCIARILRWKPKRRERRCQETLISMEVSDVKIKTK